jgi:hypothetical protein
MISNLLINTVATVLPFGALTTFSPTCNQTRRSREIHSFLVTYNFSLLLWPYVTKGRLRLFARL